MAWPRVAGTVLVLASAASTAYASPFTITATFDTSITTDPNAVSIENSIESAIAVYEGLFTNPINVSIDFTEMNDGLGQSNKQLMLTTYSQFYAAYAANAAANNNPAAGAALASGVVPDQATNPLAGMGGVGPNSPMEIPTVDAEAIGLCACANADAGFDGYINLNTHITAPGSTGSNLSYYLEPVVEHEIDEVLGLGSALGSSFQATPFTEDLFRYNSQGARTYTTNPGAKAYFTVNGTTDLAQFDNQNDGGDWADWQSNPLPPGVQAQVQDAFANPGENPSLGVEITALEAIGYDIATPEPASIALFGIGFGALVVFGWRRRRA